MALDWAFLAYLSVPPEVLILLVLINPVTQQISLEEKQRI